MQLLHHRAATLLMKLQPLSWRHDLLPGLGIVAIHLAQHLQNVTALLGKVGGHFYKLPTTVGKT